MHTAATNSLVLTDSSSFKRLASSQTGISYRGFYQHLVSRLARGAHNEQFFRELGDMLVAMAERAYAFRRMDFAEEISQALVRLPLSRQYEAVGRYYQALCIQRFGRGDVTQAVELLDRARESAPLTYRLRAIISLGTNSRYQLDNQSALSLYNDAIRFISLTGVNDPYSMIHSQKMVAVIGGENGHHRKAVAVLENLFPLARALRATQPDVYYDYMNSLAVELCEVGRLEEAKNVSRIVLSSPFANAYPEWRETQDEIELRGLRASRSIVALSNTIAEAPINEPAIGASVLAPLESGNVVRLPLARRDESPARVEASPAGEPARVFSIQDWKDKIAKQLLDDPRRRLQKPATSTEKNARIEQLEKLTSREVLMTIMDNLGDESIGEDLLRKALIVLEDLEPDENHGA